MRKVLILTLAISLPHLLSAQSLEKLKEWANNESSEIATLAEKSFAQNTLSHKEVDQAREVLEAKWRKEMLAKHRKALEANKFKWADKQLRIRKRVLGEKPDDGRSLYISMHGGGGVPAPVNDQQWDNQIMLYTPAEGVYVAPRAPVDQWNMWFVEGMDQLFESLIQAAVVAWDVNPNKVYLVGYSAGGDGVWRMAPRMADRWAAASMMAGHPGEASQESLRNLPFMIWMGEHDGAYDRNTLAIKHGRIMDSLHQADPIGYIHETHIVKGKGHWMDRADTLAISWVAKYHRNPYPRRVVWRQEEITHRSFYWLSVPEVECHHGAKVIAEYDDNRVDILSCDYSRLTLYFNDEMVDLNKPVAIYYKGKRLFKGKLRRTLATMSRTLSERGDLRYSFSTEIEVEIPEK